jgi:hypothetical protein
MALLVLMADKELVWGLEERERDGEGTYERSRVLMGSCRWCWRLPGRA